MSGYFELGAEYVYDNGIHSETFVVTRLLRDAVYGTGWAGDPTEQLILYDDVYARECSTRVTEDPADFEFDV